MSLENTIKSMLESTYPGFGQGRESSPAPQGSSNANPAKQDAIKGPGVDAAKGTAASTMAPHAAGGDKSPAVQGDSNANPEKEELDQDAPGADASKKAKKAPGLTGKPGKPKLLGVEDHEDPSVVINNPTSKGNVHVESVDDEDEDVLTDEEFQALSDEEKEQYELVELELDLDEELESLLDEEMTEDEANEFLDMLNEDEEMVEFFESVELESLNEDERAAMSTIKTAMSSRKAGKGIGTSFGDLSKAANALSTKKLDKALGRVDASRGKSGLWKPKQAGANAKGIVKSGMASRLSAKYPSMKVESTNIQTIFGETDLSEEFMTRASTVFEGVLSAKVTEIKEEIETLATEALQEAMDEYRNELAEQVNDYITYVAQEWMESNKLAVVEGLRTEVAEDFMSGLKDLFLENYITIPEDKVDVFEGLQEEVDSLKQEVNEKISEAVELTKVINGLKKEQILATVTEGMAETEVERFMTLAENLTFDSEAAFTNKVTAIKESYFPRKGNKAATIAPETLHEGASAPTEGTVELSPVMQRYIAGLGKTTFSK